MKDCCEICKWLYNEVCVNSDSDLCADFPDLDYVCSEFEKYENQNNENEIRSEDVTDV